MVVFVAGLILFIWCFPTNVRATLDLDEATILSLIARVQNLENNDEMQKKEIASLKVTVRTLQERIGEFETKQDDKMVLANTVENDRDDKADKAPMFRILPGRSNSIRDAAATQRTSRFVENEVAFYATNSAHDIQHLGQNQALVFDVIHTNLGNGYNNISSHFIAPIPGVYVFHVTICGRDAHTDSHFYASMYVNSDVKSSFIVTPYDQSSQMLVALLKAGDDVVIRNSIIDDGYIGHLYSSFSGFLLYETEGLPIVG